MSTATIRAKLAARGIDYEPPYGCSWCGDEQHHHGSQWAPIIGMHQWIQPTQTMIFARMRRRRANRPAKPTTLQDRMRAVHADAYPEWGSGDPVCATCHQLVCPHYRRLQNRLDRQRLARWAAMPTPGYDEEPPW
ncbi:hypothetical protein [Streptomyces tendae]|uniref:hypothetical protein n=1 Tax=Streptomyces tendae TaxID=1932 RepID=UPI0036648E91